MERFWGEIITKRHRTVYPQLEKLNTKTGMAQTAPWKSERTRSFR
jgi:hypothetical protein